jgi:hypothetical protein
MVKAMMAIMWPLNLEHLNANKMLAVFGNMPLMIWFQLLLEPPDDATCMLVVQFDWVSTMQQDGKRE